MRTRQDSKTGGSMSESRVLTNATGRTVARGSRRTTRRTGIDSIQRFRSRTRAWLGYGLLACGAITVVGLPYYVAEPGIRFRSDLHAWLKPSGWVGQSAGIAGQAFAMRAVVVTPGRDVLR